MKFVENYGGARVRFNANVNRVRFLSGRGLFFLKLRSLNWSKRAEGETKSAKMKRMETI